MFKRLIDFHLQKWKIDPYRKSLILRGARQVGKTSSVRTLGNTFDNYVEINFELYAEVASSIFEKDLFEVKSGHGTTLRSLRLYLDTHPNCSRACRFSSLDYSIEDTLDSRPLYAVMSLVHDTQKEAFYSLLD